METIDHKTIDQRFNKDLIVWLSKDLPDEKLNLISKQFLNYLQTYSAVKKLVKFIDILTDSSSSKHGLSSSSSRIKLLITPQFSHEFSRSLYQLPYGHLIEVWKLFIDKFDCQNVIQVNLFINFLSHLKFGQEFIPIYMRPEFDELFGRTKACLVSTNQLIQDEIEDYHLEMILSLIHVWGSIIILKMSYSNYLMPSNQVIQTQDTLWHDISLIHDYSEQKIWKQFFQKINHSNCVIRKLALKLIIQKFQYLKLAEIQTKRNEDLKEQETVDLTSKLITKIFINFTDDLSIWSCQQLVIVLPFFTESQLLKLTESFIDMLLSENNNSQEESKNLKKKSHENLNSHEENRKSNKESKESRESGAQQIEMFLSSESFTENLKLQTAFISSLFKRIAESISLAQSPKKSKKRKSENESSSLKSILNSLSDSSVWFENTNPQKQSEMWMRISVISKEVQTLNEEIHVNEEQLIELMKYFKFLPLEYLLPGNQVRCLLGLSSLIFCIKSDLIDPVTDILTRIWSGVRSIWLFNFVQSDLYIEKLILALAKVLDLSKDSETHDPRNKLLITKIISNLFQIINEEQVDQFEKIVQFLQREDRTEMLGLVLMMENLLIKNFNKLLTRKSILKKVKNLEQTCVSLANQLAKDIRMRLKLILNHYDDKQTDDQDEGQKKKRKQSHEQADGQEIKLIDWLIVVESFSNVFHYQITKLNQSDEVGLKTKWKKLLNKLIDITLDQIKNKTQNQNCYKFMTLLCQNKNLLANVLPDNFMMTIWDSIIPSVKSKKIPSLAQFDQADEIVTHEETIEKPKKKRKQNDDQQADDQQADVHQDDGQKKKKRRKNEKASDQQGDQQVDIPKQGALNLGPDKLKYEEFLESRKIKFNERKDEFEDEIFENYYEMIKPLMTELFKSVDETEFSKFIKKLIAKTKKCHFNSSSTQCLINVWKSVFSFDFYLNENKLHSLKSVLNQLMIEGIRLMQECNEADLKSEHQNKVHDKQSQPDDLKVKRSLLDLVTMILHQFKKQLSSEQLSLSYQFCIETNLIRFNNQNFINSFAHLFQGVYNVLNETILQHLNIVINSLPTFNLIIQNMIMYLIMNSDQDTFTSYDGAIQIQLENCAQSMDRLLTQLAIELPQQYSLYAPHLIAFYCYQIQTVTIHPLVRRHLISGLNRVINLLGQNQIEMIHCRLNQAGREIFKVMYENYENYYKFKGNV